MFYSESVLNAKQVPTSHGPTFSIKASVHIEIFSKTNYSLTQFFSFCSDTVWLSHGKCALLSSFEFRNCDCSFSMVARYSAFSSCCNEIDIKTRGGGRNFNRRVMGVCHLTSEIAP